MWLLRGDKAPFPPTECLNFMLNLPLRPSDVIFRGISFAWIWNEFSIARWETCFMSNWAPWPTWQVRMLGLPSSFLLTPNLGTVQYHGLPVVETHDLNQPQTRQGQFRDFGNSLQSVQNVQPNFEQQKDVVKTLHNGVKLNYLWWRFPISILKNCGEQTTQIDRSKWKWHTWLARAIPLKTAASILEPSSQSPHIPARPKGSKMQGTPGVLVGRAAPLQIS